MPGRTTSKQSSIQHKTTPKATTTPKPKAKRSAPAPTPAKGGKFLYHYTDASSAKAIVKSGYLNGSKGPGDCALGEGTYFTSKPPQTTTNHLLTNNYTTDSKHFYPKTQAFIRVDKSKVAAMDGSKRLGGRDVFVVRGDRVDLAKAGAKVGERKRYQRDAAFKGKYF
jgi:hypothetical protein